MQNPSCGIDPGLPAAMLTQAVDILGDAQAMCELIHMAAMELDECARDAIQAGIISVRDRTDRAIRTLREVRV